jgi:plasmid stabilization system protein ParE
LQYTAKIWGRARHLVYRRKLDEGLRFVFDNPLAGSSHPALPEDFRQHFVGSHVLVYQITDELIVIRRVLHQNMSLPGQL